MSKVKSIVKKPTKKQLQAHYLNRLNIIEKSLRTITLIYLPTR